MCELNLWGIETALLFAFLTCLKKRVNWTCEGLKPRLGFLGAYEPCECELNLWGIETFQTNQSCKFISSVNWTCEGLKRDNDYDYY